MIGDLTGAELEQQNPNDLADALVLLDDGEAYVVPVPVADDEPLTRRDHDRMKRRFYGSSKWAS